VFSEMSDGELYSILSVVVNTAAVSQAARQPTGVFCGNVSFYAAEGTLQRFNRQPEEWKRYITGDIRLKIISCGHHEMTQPAFISEIGEDLAAELARLDECNEQIQ
jgi:thioesterase domain-containing protein